MRLRESCGLQSRRHYNTRAEHRLGWGFHDLRFFVE
jgi:hypothetical protein